LATFALRWYEFGRKHEEIAFKIIKVRKKSHFQEEQSRMSNLKVETKTSKLMYCTKTIEHALNKD